MIKLPRFKSIALALGALCAASAGAFAIDYDWTNASGIDSNWLTPGNWTPAGPPTGGAGNNARFYNGTTGAVVINANVPTIQDILFGVNFTPGIRQVNHTAGNLTINGWLRMGIELGASGDAGTYNLSGGTLTAGRFNIGERTGTVSTVSVSGTGVLNQIAPGVDEVNWSRIGENGHANFNLSDNGLASFFGERVMIGAAGASTATITQTGGIFEVRQGKIIVADSSPNSVYNISAGIMRTVTPGPTEGANLIIGAWNNSHGQVNVSGTAQVNIVDDIIMGDGQNIVALPSRGTVTQTGGTVTARNLRMGSSQQGTATYNANGGLLDLSGELVVGENTQTVNNALFQQTAGDVNFRRLFVGRAAGSKGTLEVSAGNFLQDTVNPEDQNNWNHIGENGVAQFNVTNSAFVSLNTRTLLGTGASGNGTVTQTGGIFEVRDHELIIADQGTGRYDISGGTLQTSRNINVGNWNNGNGQLNVSGSGQVLAGMGMIIGQTENGNSSSIGVVTQTGGLVRVQNDILFGNGNGALTTSGTYNLNGGLLNMTGGEFNKGTGVAFFNFNNGRLQDLGRYNLGGTFTQTDGVLAPGPANSAGATTINANYALLSEGEIEISLFGSDPGNFDVINVNGTVSLAGSLSVTNDPIGLALGLIFTIFNNDGADPINGTFFGLPEGQDFVSGSGNMFDISYVGGDGNDIRLLVVPEPATGTFLFLTASGLFALRRRRRS